VQDGTAAFSIGGPPGAHRVRGILAVPGPIKEGDSHRCEMAGIYGIITTLQALCKKYSVRTGSVTIHCDNQQSLQAFHTDFLPNTSSTNFDLVNATWHNIQQTPLQITGHHVKGHQDDHVDLQLLSHPARLNVEMDKLAKAYWLHLTTQTPSNTMPEPIQHPIQGEKWQIWNGDQKVVDPSTDNLYGLIQNPITHQWWIRNGHISQQAHDSIDWMATEQFMRKLPANRRRWVTKTASENCGVGTTLVQWKMQKDAICPRCGNPQETTKHVTRCSGHGADAVFHEALSKVDKYLQRTDTRPDLHDAILHCLKQWKHCQRITISHFSPDIQQAMRQQHQIGWQDLIEGLVTKTWRQLQHQHYRSLGRRCSSQKWIQGLLRQLHHVGWNLWNHRCHVKHRVLKPRHAQEEERLDAAITSTYSKGNTRMLQGDRHHFNQNLLQLLRKPVQYKQAWLANVMVAQQRFERIAAQDAELDLLNREKSSLYQYMKTNIPS